MPLAGDATVHLSGAAMALLAGEAKIQLAWEARCCRPVTDMVWEPRMSDWWTPRWLRCGWCCVCDSDDAGWPSTDDGWALDENNAALISDDMKAAMDAASASIVAGDISVHDYRSDNTCPM